MANETDITLLQDLSLPLVGTDYVEVRRGAELYRCHGDWLTGGGEPYVLKANNEAPDVGYTNVYPIGGATMGTPPAPGQAGDWFRSLIPSADGSFVTSRHYVSHDGVNWTHVGEREKEKWTTVAIADSPVAITWDERRYLDGATTTAANRLVFNLAAPLPDATEEGHVILKALPGRTLTNEYFQVVANDGAGGQRQILSDAGVTVDSTINISNRAIGGMELIYNHSTNLINAYALPIEP